MPLQRGVSQVERSDIVTALTNGFVKVPTLPEFCCTGVIVAFCLVFHLSFLRVQAKLSLPACPEFDVPADLHEALLNGTILPNTSFAPAAYSAIRRSVYMHSQPREMQLARDQETCSCIASAGFCDERCQNRALQQVREGWCYLERPCCQSSTCRHPSALATSLSCSLHLHRLPPPPGSIALHPCCLPDPHRLSKECTTINCSCGPESCRNRPFAQLFSAGPLPLQLIMTGSKGWGVKTTSNLRKGQLVVEYVGEVIDRESWEVRCSAKADAL